MTQQYTVTNCRNCPMVTMCQTDKIWICGHPTDPAKNVRGKNGRPFDMMVDGKRTPEDCPLATKPLVLGLVGATDEMATEIQLHLKDLTPEQLVTFVKNLKTKFKGQDVVIPLDTIEFPEG